MLSAPPRLLLFAIVVTLVLLSTTVPAASSEPVPCNVPEETDTKVGEKVSYRPCADFTYSPISPTVSDTVSFDASVSYQPYGGSIEQYFWYFGGREEREARGPTIEKSFDEPGNYTVGLTVINNRGESTDHEKTVTVEDTPPTARFNYHPPEPKLGEEINFDGSNSFDLESNIEEYIWEMGDGAVINARRFEYSYDKYGEYNVTLTVDDGRRTDSTTKTINITPVAPTPEIKVGGASDEITVEDDIKVNASGTYDPDSETLEYSWEFGDGSTGEGVSVNHSYIAPGDYRITLTVKDDYRVVRKNRTVTVENRPPVVILDRFPNGSVNAEETVVFDASQSHDPDTEISEVRWELGDDETATGETVEHSYDGFGEYTVSVEASDGSASTEKNTSITVFPSKETILSKNDGMVWIGLGVNAMMPLTRALISLLAVTSFLIILVMVAIKNRHIIEHYVLLRPA